MAEHIDHSSSGVIAPRTSTESMVFAGAVWREERDALALPHLEVDAGHRGGLADAYGRARPNTVAAPKQTVAETSGAYPPNLERPRVVGELADR